MAIRSSAGALLLLLGLVLGGCGEDASSDLGEEGAVQDSATTPGPSSEVPEAVFDREFIFLSRTTDSTLFLPWLFRTRVHAGGIHREITSSMVRSGAWEILSRDSSETPILRNPERILPSEKVRLIAGDDRQFESVYFRDPPREVETQLLEILAEWPRPGGEPIFVYRGRVLLPSTSVEGIVLDLARRWSLPDSTIGDWIFLQGEGGVQLFLEEVFPIQEQRGDTKYRGWIRIEPSAGPWAEVSVRWEEMRSFERARRDIPARWSFSSPGGDLEGELSAISSDLTVMEGEGPVLPAMGLFQVEGEIRVLERELRVSGVIRHQQY